MIVRLATCLGLITTCIGDNLHRFSVNGEDAGLGSPWVGLFFTVIFTGIGIAAVWRWKALDQ